MQCSLSANVTDETVFLLMNIAPANDILERKSIAKCLLALGRLPCCRSKQLIQNKPSHARRLVKLYVPYLRFRWPLTRRDVRPPRTMFDHPSGNEEKMAYVEVL